MIRCFGFIGVFFFAYSAVNVEASDVLTVRTALRSEAAITAVCTEYAARRSAYADLARQVAQHREQLAFVIAQNNAADARRLEQQIDAASAHMVLARNSVDFYALKAFSHDIELRDTSSYVHFYLRDRDAPPHPAAQVYAAVPNVAKVNVDLIVDQSNAGGATSDLAIDIRFNVGSYRIPVSARALTFVPTARVTGNVGALCSALSSDAPIAEVRANFDVDWPRLVTQKFRYVTAADANIEHTRRNDLAGKILLFEGLTTFLERMLVDRSYRLVQDVAFYDQPSFVPMRAPPPNDRVGGPRLLTPGGGLGAPVVYEYQTIFNVFDGVAAEFGAASIVLTKQDLIALRGDLASAMRLDGNTLLLTWSKGGQTLELCFHRELNGLRLSCVRMNGTSKWQLRRLGQ